MGKQKGTSKIKKFKKGWGAPRLRSKYIDEKSPFLDWVNQFGFERTSLGKYLGKVEEYLPLQKIVILFIFSLLLSFVLFFEIEFDYNFTPGDLVHRNVKSPLNFEVTDTEATEEKKVKAEKNVPMVFDYDPEAYERISNRIYSSFRTMRKLIYAQKWSRSEVKRIQETKKFFIHKPEFEKSLGVEIPDRLFEWLVSMKFSPLYENILIRVFESWARFKIAEAPEKVIPTDHTKVVLRVIWEAAIGEEYIIPVVDVVDVNKHSNFKMSVAKGWDRLTKRNQKNLEKLAKLLLDPNMTYNLQETKSRQQKAMQEVLPIVIAVKKNQTVISEGTVISPTHMRLLHEIRTAEATRKHRLTEIVTALLFVSLILVFFSYLRRFSLNKVKVESKDILVMGVVTFVVTVVTKIFLFMTDKAFMVQFGHVLPSDFFLYLAPVAAGPMLVGLLMISGEVVWLFTVFLALVLGVMLDFNFAYALVTVAGGIAAARGVHGCKKRNDIYRAGVRTGLVNALILMSIVSIQGMTETKAFLNELIWLVPAGFLSGIFSSMLAMMVIPILESLFNYTTDVRLLELSNLNHPLLKEMLVKAPGTYHHSMVVGSMVEAAAEEIGANPLLARVMAYYHDVGKMEHANYFIENQRSGHNPHDYISPYMSKTILVAHMKDGVELGLKYNLGDPIIDGIVQHHGTTLISYFHNKAIEANEDEDRHTEEQDFRYPGPKPQFKESGLLMLADSIEAAARSLDEPTPVRLQNIVRNIIQRKFMDAQLDECNLTLKDLSTIEDAFVQILFGIYHQRIDYPKKAGGGAGDKPDPGIKLTRIGQ